MMQWKKLGLVFGPDGSRWWARSHAMIPTPVRISDDVIRVYVTCCDASGVGRPGYVDVSAHSPLRVLDVSKEPLLDVGSPGSFDENGVLACSVVARADGSLLMYYAGFELGTKIRYRLLTGAAVSSDGGKSFRRLQTTPVLERSHDEQLFRGGPYCIRDQRFRLWYVAGSGWTDVDGKAMPVYDIRYSESHDGVEWPRTGQVQLRITGEDEHGFGRPYVIPGPRGGYRMFYSIRRRSLGAYRLGYAESEDGRTWVRKDDQLNLDVGPDDFDSDAIMYAAPIEIDGTLCVFYNGNEFGKSGFAVARLESE